MVALSQWPTGCAKPAPALPLSPGKADRCPHSLINTHPTPCQAWLPTKSPTLHPHRTLRSPGIPPSPSPGCWWGGAAASEGGGPGSQSPQRWAGPGSGQMAKSGLLPNLETDHLASRNVTRMRCPRPPHLTLRPLGGAGVTPGWWQSRRMDEDASLRTERSPGQTPGTPDSRPTAASDLPPKPPHSPGTPSTALRTSPPTAAEPEAAAAACRVDLRAQAPCFRTRVSD